MKVKLLRKMRKQFSIEFCPNGVLRWGDIWYVGKYLLTDKYNEYYEISFETRQEAIDKMLNRVRKEYINYSRKAKVGVYNGKKVWWNNK